MAGPTAEFWQERFENKQMPWDRGRCSPGLLSWLDAWALTPCRIAVPGCGTGWEVAELAQQGFDVVGIDYTQAAVDKTLEYCQKQGVSAEIIRADVLSYDSTAPFDDVYGQTCLCALHPDHWVAYAGQLRAWLKPGGVLAQFQRPAARGLRFPGAVNPCILNLHPISGLATPVKREIAPHVRRAVQHWIIAWRG